MTTIAQGRLNPQAEALEEAQSLIRLEVKDGFFKMRSRAEIDARVRRIIFSALGKIKSRDLKAAAYNSLVQFYNKQRQLISAIGMSRLLLFLALTRLTEKGKPKEERSAYTATMTEKSAREIIAKSDTPFYSDKVIELGQPLNKYHKEYMERHVAPVLDAMAKAKAIDPTSPIKMSLRGRAELEVRYEWHQDQLTDFNERGVKLVIVSAHADCSERCRKWQGRVYSLDGTSGTTSDGRKYVPLEEATNILTPNGKWFNGLFGFNCRHYMVEYKPGYQFPRVSAKVEKKQYQITLKQRSYERHVLKWKVEAEMMMGVDKDKYKRAKAKAKAWDKAYIDYSKKHDRPYYPSRTKIL